MYSHSIQGAVGTIHCLVSVRLCPCPEWIAQRPQDYQGAVSRRKCPDKGEALWPSMYATLGPLALFLLQAL